MEIYNLNKSTKKFGQLDVQIPAFEKGINHAIE